MKNRNFVWHRISKIKIHIKLSSLNLKKKETKPNPFLALGIAAASSDEGFFQPRWRYSGKPDPDENS